MALSDPKIRTAKIRDRAYKLSDEHGLFLLVQTTGAKLWRFSYRFGGKQKTLALGRYPEVLLTDARERRLAARRMLEAGIDPGGARRVRPGAAPVGSFEALAREWHARQQDVWVQAHAERVLARLVEDVFPQIGSLPAAVITPQEVLAMLQKVEARGAIDTAKRVRQTVSQIFRYGVAAGKLHHDPARDIRDALKPSPRGGHFASLKEADLPDFLHRLSQYDGDEQTRLAVEFMLHVFVRTNELIEARKSEFEHLKDPERAAWRIPAARMKMSREHIVPLSEQARLLALRLIELAGDSPYLLPGRLGGTISNNTLLFACYRIGYHNRTTVHGFRGTASTILNEREYPEDWIEMQLAHGPKNAIRAAYNSAKWLKQRREMLAWYSGFLTRKANEGRLLS